MGKLRLGGIPQLCDLVTNTSNFELELLCLRSLDILRILVIELVWHEAMGQWHLGVQSLFIVCVKRNHVGMCIIMFCKFLLLLLL